MVAFPYLEFVIGCSLVTFSLETFLDLRQYGAVYRREISPLLKGVVSEERFRKSRDYSLDKMNLHLVQSVYELVLELVVLLYYVMPWAWKAAGQVYPDWTGSNEIAHSLSFFVATSLWSQITGLPFSLYSTFVVEARHGFNKQTLWGFFKDTLLSNLLSLTIGPPIISALILVIQHGGTSWELALKLWLLVFSISVVMMALYPALIAPLFNKYTPLPEGPLRTEIEGLAASLKFPLKKLLVVDGSKRSAHSNAYLYGFFKSKRIVLFDTLINQCKDNQEQVVAVIAHELGHWKLRHTALSFLASQLLVFLHFLAYAFMGSSPELYRSFGFSSQPSLIGLLLVQQVITPVGPLLSCALNAMSRLFEFQADAFARQLGYSEPLKEALVKLQEENLGAMATDPWYSTYHYSHPPLVERLAALGKQEKKED